MSSPVGQLALVVEDEALTRQFLAEALATAGWSVRVAGRLDDAISALHNAPFDLILSDVRLPDGDAFDLARAVGALNVDSTANSPHCIALSAELDATLTQRLLDAGFARALAKPLALTTLLDAVAEIAAGNDKAARMHNLPRLPGIPASGASMDADPASLPHLDDAHAVRICGSAQNVRAMRELLRAELPGMIDQLEASSRQNDTTDARDVLHRLQSAAGFCGAARLGALIRSSDLHHADQATVAERIAPTLEASRTLLGLLQHTGAQQQT